MKKGFLNFHRIVSGACENHSDVEAGLFGEICRKMQDFHGSETSVRLQVTFDDGWESHIREALPVLLKTRQTGIFFIITSFVGKQGYLTWRDVQELSRCGMEIGSHTHTHPENLCRLSGEKIREELRISKEILEDRIHQPVMSLSAPHGYWNQHVFLLCQETHYRRFFTSEPGYNSGQKTQSPLCRFNAHQRTSLREIERILCQSTLLLTQLKIRYHLLQHLKKAVSEKTFQNIRMKLCR